MTSDTVLITLMGTFRIPNTVIRTSDTKRYIVYSEIEVGEKPLDCGYFVEGDCVAPPFGIQGHYYRPTEEEQKGFCKNENRFQYCPRFTAYQEHLKAIGLRKN